MLSGDSVCGIVHGSITMALTGIEGTSTLRLSHKLIPAMEHQQLRFNHAPDVTYHAYQHDIISPIHPGTRS